MPHAPDSLLERLEEIPESTGVYLFRDARGRVLYVGKAVNLRARVRQYTGLHDGRPMVRLLMRQAANVEVVLTANEKEALLLENTLIKRFTPRYNVQLRDDKNFLHLRIDPREPWPRYTLVRRIRADGARTYGPYDSAGRARRTLAFLQRHFPLRTCSDAVLRSRRRPCLLHQLGRCVAPCVEGHTTAEAYAELVQESMLFLEGRNEELVRRVEERMREASERLAFEEAARHRDLLLAIRGTMERQHVVDRRLGDRDAWGIHREGDRGLAVRLAVREGFLLAPHAWPLDGLADDEGEVVTRVLLAAYDRDRPPPPEVLVPTLPGSPEGVAELLGALRGGRVRLHRPQRGDKARLLELALRNARMRFLHRTSVAERSARAAEALAEVLGLPAPPSRIECFDNSTLGGSNPVAAQVVFVDGRPERRSWRTYRLRSVQGPDDYAAMAEALERRFRRAAEEGGAPDLVVVDGGRGQLNVALRVLAETGFGDLPVIGLAKPRTERRRGAAEGVPVDRIVVPGRPDPIRLPDHHPALNLLRTVRDAAHDHAIRAQRRARSRSRLASALDEVPGIGPARRKALLRHFGSLRALAEADEAALRAVPGIGPATARTLAQALAAAREEAAVRDGPDGAAGSAPPPGGPATPPGSPGDPGNGPPAPSCEPSRTPG